MTFGDPRDWLPDAPQREAALARGRSVLGHLLTKDEAGPLLQARLDRIRLSREGSDENG